MSKKNNFTLLEVVLALTALLLLTGLISGVAFSLPGSYRSLQATGRRTLELAALDRIADRAVGNAVPFSWPDAHQQNQPVFKGDPQLLITAFRTKPDGMYLAGIGFLALGLRGHTLVAQMRGEPILWRDKTEPLAETLAEEEILHDVAEFSFLYPQYISGKLEWKTDWDEAADRELPRAVGWRIRFTDGTEVSYLRRTAGNSAVTSFGRRSDAWTAL